MKAIDKNLNADSRVITSKMIIKGRRNSRTIESKNWIVGTELLSLNISPRSWYKNVKNRRKTIYLFTTN